MTTRPRLSLSVQYPDERLKDIITRQKLRRWVNAALQMPAEITLREIYRAVQKKSDAPLFDFHANPNPQCPIGRNIREALDPPLLDAQAAMEQALENYTLQDVADRIAQRL